jgi:basic amino acid/polyamine antiporter, APA family
LFERVPLESAQADAADAVSGPELPRHLGLASLTMLGVGNAIGAGIFVLTGTAAAQHAGPAIALSYVIAGVVCLLTSLCYAEISALIPSAGGSFAYARVTLGRYGAWLVGWCMIAEYLIAGSTVAVGWSGYASSLLQQIGWSLPTALSSAPLEMREGRIVASGSYVNLPALLLVLACTWVLYRGLRESNFVSHLMVAIKVIVIVIVVLVGAAYVSPDHWTPFVPAADGSGRFGWGGVLTASAIAFFSYSGFEAMSTAARETRNPARDLPRALFWALGICVLLYVSMAMVMTGMVPYSTLDTASPISTALLHASDRLGWLVLLVNVGTVIGLGAPVLISIYGQVRTFYAMARAGYMPEMFGRVHPRHRTPAVGTLSTGLAAAVVAAILPIDLLGELVSMGILIAFASVCLGVIVLRRDYPSVPRPFRVPLYPWVPALGLFSCVGLMVTLPRLTWIYIAVWLVIGTLIFLISARRRRNSQAARQGWVGT